MENGGSSWIWRGAAVVGLLTVAACGSSAKKAASPTRGSTATTVRTTSSSGSLLGDQRTVDPCSLVNANDLKTMGSALVSQGLEFNTCEVKITPTGINGIVNLDIDTNQKSANFNLSRVESQANVSTAGSLQVINGRPTPGTNACYGAVLLPDKTLISISAKPNNTNANGANFCDLEAGVTNGVAAALNSHKVVHRHYPPNSVGQLDMCSLVSKADLTSIVQGLVAETNASPSGHNCNWGDPNDRTGTSPHVLLSTYLSAYKLNTDQGGKIENIAGRDTLITSQQGGSGSGLPASCDAQTTAYTWPTGLGNTATASSANNVPPPAQFGGPQLIEEPQLSIYANASEQQNCGAVRALAAKVWPQLPPAP
jgi:hypothetical protein